METSSRRSRAGARRGHAASRHGETRAAAGRVDGVGLVSLGSPVEGEEAEDLGIAVCVGFSGCHGQITTYYVIGNYPCP